MGSRGEAHTGDAMRLRRLFDWLPFGSKAGRAQRDVERRHDQAVDAQRRRQAHYRSVTRTDANGRDTGDRS
jgi:hypothetical protein